MTQGDPRSQDRYPDRGPFSPGSIPLTARTIVGLVVVVVGSLGTLLLLSRQHTPELNAQSAKSFQDGARPILVKYCLECHSTKAKKGSLDLERFNSEDDVRKDIKVWQGIVEQVEAGEMPPKKHPQPSADETKQLLSWTKNFLDAEARANSGDPGHVPLRRLSNTEYDCTIRDLTGVDLRPARDFPADGAAGEGFTNAAESLSDISPALLTKYLNAAKDTADHLVLLPDGLRFSPGKTRRDWTDECVAKLRAFYSQYASADGQLPLQPYILATIRYRDRLTTEQLTIAEVARSEKLNQNYLSALWKVLTAKEPSMPLDLVRARWRAASEKDAPTVLAEVTAWQTMLWKTARIGSYMMPAGSGFTESFSRQVPVTSTRVDAVLIKLPLKLTPGKHEVVVRLTARELTGANNASVVWHQPRLEGPGKAPILLREIGSVAPKFDVDLTELFAGTERYLDAASELARDEKSSIAEIATKHKLHPELLARWQSILNLPRTNKAAAFRTRVGAPLTFLDEKTPKNEQWPSISGWRKKGTDLPVVLSNSADTTFQIPGRVSGRGVAAHPLPNEFVAVTWKSPGDLSIRLEAKVSHAHPACGNGVGWWIEHRRGTDATVLGDGIVELGKESRPTTEWVKVSKGELIVLAVEPRDNNHSCDMTEVALRVISNEAEPRTWDLAKDVVQTIQTGNPHSDGFKNVDTWGFVRGPSVGIGNKGTPTIVPGSLVDQWRTSIIASRSSADRARIAHQIQKLLTSPRPVTESVDRTQFDRLVDFAGPLLFGVDLSRFARPVADVSKYGPISDRYGKGIDGSSIDPSSINVPVGTDIEWRLPAAMVVGRELSVEARLPTANSDVVIQAGSIVDVATAKSPTWDVRLLAPSAGTRFQQFQTGMQQFRELFPLFICFPNVVPTDEVVSLKMFHREDDPLARLFLDDTGRQRVDRLWEELRFVSRQAVAENEYLPQFIGFVTQDQPKTMVSFFEGMRPAFQKRADEQLQREQSAIASHLSAVERFADRAFRRPLSPKEKADLGEQYRAIRSKGASHDEAVRGLVTRILIAPAFLFRIEQAPPGKQPGAINHHELATRLSYFLWSSMPDDELRALANQGKLGNPGVLQAQAIRMIGDPRARSLAIEFGAQWLHVRGFDELKEKNERLFPTFNAELKNAINEEAIQFFLDLFQNNRRVLNVLDADYVFANEVLAKHYGIPGIMGAQWRKIDGVRKYGRGGVLGMASVQAKQSGASRTSPVLRGNWVVETLLGEKLPRPPANVPQLPEMEGADKLTMRQLVEKHASNAECAVCHVRIDPYGFALERYDPIGRWREKDLGGLPIDSAAKLRDGTEFNGIDGLRDYLLSKKKDVVVRLFCRRLLGYALGRAVTLSDSATIDQMVKSLERDEGRVQSLVKTIIASPQFRQVRGQEQ